MKVVFMDLPEGGVTAKIPGTGAPFVTTVIEEEESTPELSTADSVNTSVALVGSTFGGRARNTEMDPGLAYSTTVGVSETPSNSIEESLTVHEALPPSPAVTAPSNTRRLLTFSLLVRVVPTDTAGASAEIVLTVTDASVDLVPALSDTVSTSAEVVSPPVSFARTTSTDPSTPLTSTTPQSSLNDGAVCLHPHANTSKLAAPRAGSTSSSKLLVASRDSVVPPCCTDCVDPP